MLGPQLTGPELCRQPLQHTGIPIQPSRSQQYRQVSAVLVHSGPGMQQHAAVLQRNSSACQCTPPDGAIAAAGQKPSLAGLRPRI